MTANLQRTVSTPIPDTTSAVLVNPPKPVDPVDTLVGLRDHRDARPLVSIGTEELSEEDRRYSNVACTD